MAGTQQYTEGLTALVAQTILSADSDQKNSLQGIDVSGLVDRATCYVRENFSTYRYFDDSVLPVVLPFIVAPSEGDGRWVMVATDVPGGGTTLGALYFYDNATVQLTGPMTLDSWVTLAPAVFGAGADNTSDLALDSDRRIEYTGPTKRVSIEAGLTLWATDDQAFRETYEVAIFKNGNLLAESSQELAPGDVQAGLSKSGHVTTQVVDILASGDILDIRVRTRMTGDTDTFLASAYLQISQ